MLDHREWPDGAGQVRLMIDGLPDVLGRVNFTLLWREPDGQKRGQCFYAAGPDEHAANLRRNLAERMEKTDA